MIEVAALTQRYGAYTAVRDLSFRVEPGEVVGFLGPNGAGKTTTLKVVAAFLAPSQGRVTVAGHDVATDPLAARRALGYLPEHCPLYPEMLVRGFLDFVARVRGVLGADRARAVEAAARRCLLDDVLERPIGELSKGYRQRVGIAQALVHDPPVVVLDEPTHGLDPNQVLEVRALVRDLGRERTVLFSSHVLPEVEATCRRVLVLHQGRLVADATLDDLRRRASGGAVRARFAAVTSATPEQLRALDGVADVARDGEAFVVRPRADVADLPARLFRFAVDRGLELVELAPVALTLEDVFTALTRPEGA
ncbi:MAG: ATP-binding cassette domain-containing protein [Planctomycetes bacterium]|nr:ATP-binding cassette domain-containing protein [Planctomycetota bacterium]